MNIEDLRHGHTIRVKLLPVAQQAFKSAPLKNFEIFLKNTDEGELLVIWEGLDQPLFAKVENKSHHDQILYQLDRGDPILSKVDAVQSGNQVQEIWVEIHFLNGASTFPSMELGIDEKILDQLAERLRRPNIDLLDACEYLKEDFVLSWPNRLDQSIVPLCGERWIVLPSQHAEELTFERFRLLGAKHVIDVVRQGKGKTLVVERLVWKPKIVYGSGREPLWLLHGKLNFEDSTVAAQMKSGDFTNLDSIVQGASSYLNLWQKFQDLEVSKISRIGRDMGTFPYSKCSRNHDEYAWEFKLDADFSQIRGLENKIMEIGGDVTFEATSGHVDFDQMFLKRNQQQLKESKTFAGKCIKIVSGKSMIFLQSSEDQRNEPPEKGSLYLSVFGDKVRLDRRQEAINKILNNENGISTLGHLIEGYNAPARRLHSKAPMSKIAKECFRGDPTENQKKAVDLALNTPDIAIIQGPPGTGKTRTIAAIVQRLNEISKKEGLHKTLYLLTSFQHDAVETVAESTQLMGLPAIKYGKKQGQSDHSTNPQIKHWTSELIAKIEDDLSNTGERPLSQILKEVSNARLAYAQSPGTAEHTSKLLKGIADLIREVLPYELVQLCLDESRKLISQTPIEDFEKEATRKAIVGLRVCAASFSDDGPRSANKLLRHKDQLSLNKDDTELLGKASIWDESSEDDPSFLGELAELQERLLDTISDKGSTSQVVLALTSVATILEKIEEAIINQIEKSPTEGPSAAFEDFIDRLRQEPQSGIDAISRYTRLLAATCQGSSAKKVIEMLDPKFPMFDTVIIDEAARANPLDLLIPMSLARKRIILVGDHRQLPHLLEPDVEKDLAASVNVETEKKIKESLFQRLFETAQKSQRESGIQRCVTLNRQFRMHPELAHLVSSSFYEPHGEPYESPSNEEFSNAFDHQLQGKEAGKRFIWRSVPNSMGAEERPSGGFSWSRQIEAEYVAKEAKYLLDSAPWLSVGIITFYSAQVNAILKALQKKDITERNEHANSLAVSPQYGTFPPGQKNKHGDIERLRIGTVDAFQGKEFDVVILSPVRSNTIKFSPEGAKQSLIRRKFGHLLLPNRLCVAMSRQRSLLIVVGDDKMFVPLPNNNLERHPVSGLPKFLTMCNSPIGLHSNI